MRKFYKPLIVACGLLGATAMYAQDSTNVATETEPVTEEPTDIYEMDLEALMNMDMEVTVASKKAEKISDAPASITAYSDKDIEMYGYYTLADLAGITAGYSAPKGLNVQQFETRGQYTSGGFDNNKHLVLVDGIPVYNARANMASGDEAMPLMGFKRVEFLKGPGSALYGIGAFNGVVNLVSKDREENGTDVQGKISLGNYDAKKRVMFNVVNKSDAGVAKVSAGYYAKDATMQAIGDGTDPDALATYNDYSTSFYMNASFKLTDTKLKGFKTGMIYQKRSSGLGEWWMDQQNQTYQFTESQFEQFIPYIGYERDLTDKLTVNAYIKKNFSTEKYIGSNGWQAALYWGGAGLSAFKFDVNETEYFGEVRYQANEQLSLVGGLNIVSRYGTGAPSSYVYTVLKNQGTLYDYNSDFSKRTSTYNTYSAFGQAQYKVDFLSGLNLTGGLRLDMGRVNAASDGEVTNKYDQLSPRLAVVQKLTDKITTKLMYGKALRAPMIKEVGGNEEAKSILEGSDEADKVADAVNVPVLSPETIDSYEAVVSYNDKRVGVSLTGFINRTENAMYRGQTGTGQPIVQNIDGTIDAKGVEIEASVVPLVTSKHIVKISANYATATVDLPLTTTGSTNTDTIAGGRPYNTPTQKFNMIGTYTFMNPMKLTLALIYTHTSSYNIGGYSPWRTSGSDADDFNGKYGGQNLLDLNITGELTKNLGLELQVRNVTNNSYITPAFFGSRKLNVPGAGRSYLATISYKF
jgi:outer membrane receptor for ferrienterochelin and colicins